MFRALTLNIHKGFTSFNRRFMLHELRDAIRKSHADVVFLQEVQGEHSERESQHDAWPDASQYEFLADEVWQDFAYGRNAVYTEGHHGNAILSKFPIERWDRVDISTNRVERRGHLYCRLTVPDVGETLHCICLHLGLSAVSRRKQLGMVAEYVNTHVPTEEPLVIAGDTNDWTGAPSRGFIKRLGLCEVSSVSKGLPAPTFPARFPMMRLDRMFVRNLDVVTTTVLNQSDWRKLSDHLPITADLEFVSVRVKHE